MFPESHAQWLRRKSPPAMRTCQWTSNRLFLRLRDKRCVLNNPSGKQMQVVHLPPPHPANNPRGWADIPPPSSPEQWRVARNGVGWGGVHSFSLDPYKQINQGRLYALSGSGGSPPRKLHIATFAPAKHTETSDHAGDSTSFPSRSVEEAGRGIQDLSMSWEQQRSRFWTRAFAFLNEITQKLLVLRGL